MEFDMIETIATHIPEILQICTLVVTLAAAITALTPTPKDDGIVRKIRKVIDFLALNFGNAKNRD
jgi:hypothetical protein